MTTQLALGDVARDEAIDRVARKNEVHVAEFGVIIGWLATVYGEPFTSDDVWANAGSWTRELTDPRAIGAAFSKASNERLIRPTGRFVKSKRAACHGRPVREWEGVPVSEHDRHDWKDLYYD